MGQKVEWIFKRPDRFTFILAKCGIWEAQLAKSVYSKGQVFIFPGKKSKESVPAFLGDATTNIPDPNNLIKLIDEVSRVMVQALPDCEKVYLASLNKGRDRILHFWLMPRNKHEHMEFLEMKGQSGNKVNDGFALLANLRNGFVNSKRTGNWNKMPPEPSEKGQEDLNKEWLEYAQAYEKMFRRLRRKATS